MTDDITGLRAVTRVLRLTGMCTKYVHKCRRIYNKDTDFRSQWLEILFCYHQNEHNWLSAKDYEFCLRSVEF